MECRKEKKWKKKKVVQPPPPTLGKKYYGTKGMGWCTIHIVNRHPMAHPNPPPPPPAGLTLSPTQKQRWSVSFRSSYKWVETGEPIKRIVLDIKTPRSLLAFFWLPDQFTNGHWICKQVHETVFFFYCPSFIPSSHPWTCDLIFLTVVVFHMRDWKIYIHIYTRPPGGFLK